MTSSDEDVDMSLAPPLRAEHASPGDGGNRVRGEAGGALEPTTLENVRCSDRTRSREDACLVDDVADALSMLDHGPIAREKGLRALGDVKWQDPRVYKDPRVYVVLLQGLCEHLTEGVKLEM